MVERVFNSFRGRIGLFIFKIVPTSDNFEDGASVLMHHYLLRRGGESARQRKSCEATLARADGVVLIKKMILLTSTTPAAATASAFPSSAEEGSSFPIPAAVSTVNKPSRRSRGVLRARRT